MVSPEFLYEKLNSWSSTHRPTSVGHNTWMHGSLGELGTGALRPEEDQGPWCPPAPCPKRPPHLGPLWSDAELPGISLPEAEAVFLPDRRAQKGTEGVTHHVPPSLFLLAVQGRAVHKLSVI